MMLETTYKETTMYLETLPFHILTLEACHILSESWKNLVPNFSRPVLVEPNQSFEEILGELA